MQKVNDYMINSMQFLYLVASYLFGNILTAYIVTKWRHNVDIRDEGSGNPGARNMGRVYGKGYFVATLLAVIIGHIYPVLFKGKGGKGISTFIGGLIAFDYLIALTLVAVFIIFYLIFKGFTKPGLITIACLPLCMILYSYSIVTTILSALIIVLILYVNRE